VRSNELAGRDVVIWAVSSALWIGGSDTFDENHGAESHRVAVLLLAVPYQTDAAHLENDLPAHAIVAVLPQSLASVGVW
jgi:hypothetical protein